MRKIGLFLTLAVLLAGVSAQAQKKSPKPRASAPAVEGTKILIQDDNGGGYVFIDLTSGEFRGNLCEYGIELTGVGDVKIEGCNVYFSVIQKRYRMFASVNMCDHQAKCAMEMFMLPPTPFEIEPILEYWMDNDMNDNRGDCASFSPKN